MMARDLDGRIAVVTGGSRGLGRAITLELSRRGAFVAINYQHNDAEAEKTLNLVEAGGDGPNSTGATSATPRPYARCSTRLPSNTARSAS